MAESFADKISSILCSAPASFDPENDLNEETVARVTDEKVEFENDEKLSSLRTRNAPLLEDEDKRYKGKKSSRSKIFDTEDEEFDQLEVAQSDSEESSNDYSNEEDQSFENKSDDENEEDDEDENEEGDEDENDEDDEDENDDDDEDENDLDEDNVEQQTSKFKVMDLSGQISKGESVRHQLKMWENLLEVRIQLQKCLLASNKLPQGELFNEIKQTDNSKLIEAHKSSINSITGLLNGLLKLQSLVVKKYPETKDLLSNQDDKSDKNNDDDEEIPSDTEDELEDEEMEEDMPQKKRKLNEYETEIAKRHTSYKKYRNSVIDKWNEKTRLASSSSTSTHAINSVVNYIEHILTEEEALIKKSQRKQSEYEIMGEADSEESNPNIYDDTDFYHQLLREFIEVKSADITDPIQLSQQWVQLQSMRSKMKRKVDTSATKGRKIKYVVHKKLVNFIAPVDRSEWQEEAATNFYKNIFGKNCPEVSN